MALAVREAAEKLGIKKPDPDPQITLYKPLRDTLQQAWPERASAPDPQGIRDFKAMCLEFKAQGKLLSDWEDPENDYRGTWKIARSYDDRLKDYEAACDRELDRRARMANSPESVRTEILCT